MKSKIVLLNVLTKSKPKLTRLILDYFSEIDPSKITYSSEAELDYPHIDSYWKDENRRPYFIERDANTIGFVLINDWVVNKDFNAQYSIAEFYVRTEYRRNGVGSDVVKMLFKRFTGKWEVRQDPNNLIAIAFWKACISENTYGDYSASMINGEVVLVFTTS